MSYHDPVMLTECIEGMQLKQNGIYVDATFGGGGHAKAILKNLSKEGHLYGFDQDEDAKANLLDNENFTFIQQNFRYLDKALRLEGIRQVDAILADLGVSSHQLNEGARGFSYRFDAELDMRMNQQGERKADDILNTYSAEELQNVFSKYGELRNSKTLAMAIIKERRIKPINTIGDLLNITQPLIRGTRNKYLSQVFQAIRIEVNEEMDVLQDFLIAAKKIVRPGGRIVIMSYHSLEDRLVKNFFKSGNLSGELEKDFYGNITRPFRIITKKAVAASEAELEINPRARSARLRIAEKVSEPNGQKEKKY